jgi:hypothetical protein
MTSTEHRTPLTGDLRERLRATDRAVAAAHQAHVLEAMRGVRWERRGLLRRLTRS